jgi:hypothetical protein
LRVIPFGDYYILAGKGYLFPQKATRFIKLFFADIREKKKPFKLTPKTIYEIFLTKKEVKPERLPPIERFKLLCKEGGLKEDDVNQIIERIRERVLNRGGLGDIEKELIAKLKPHPSFNLEEIIQTFMDLWNSFASKEKGYIEKGPVESTLISAGMSYLQMRIDPKRFKNEKRASEKAEQVMKEWLKTPRQELDGKTPEELILEERQKLKNPEKTVKFHINISYLVPFQEVIQKANEAFLRGRKLLMKREPFKALEAYKEYISYNHQNPVVWHNMGIAYILLRDRDNAKKCFEKALQIKPDYELAKRNLEILDRATDEDIVRMAEEFRVVVVNKGKKIEVEFPW